MASKIILGSLAFIGGLSILAVAGLVGLRIYGDIVEREIDDICNLESS